MKVLIISSGYPTEKYRGNGIFEFDQAKAISRLGHDVIFVSIDLRSLRRWRKWGFEKFEKEGILVYGVNFPLGRIPKEILIFFAIIGLKKLYSKIEKQSGKPDIMHAHFTELAYTASKLKDITGVPLVITEHSSEINKEVIDENLYKIAKKAYSKADSIISVSPALSKKIKKHFNEDPISIPNIVDLKVFKFAERSADGNFNFVSTGNLIDTKRMDLTVEAFYNAFKNNHKITLTIFGQGPKYKMLQDLIDKYNLNSQVKLMGQCSREEIADQLKKTDCFVLASQSETFGVAYIEALAMGVPVIATKCGGPEAFINESNGLMVEVNNIKQLTNAMDYMYKNIDKFDRESIANMTVEEFSPEAVASTIISQYNEVLNK